MGLEDGATEVEEFPIADVQEVKKSANKNGKIENLVIKKPLNKKNDLRWEDLRED